MQRRRRARFDPAISSAPAAGKSSAVPLGRVRSNGGVEQEAALGVEKMPLIRSLDEKFAGFLFRRRGGGGGGSEKLKAPRGSTCLGANAPCDRRSASARFPPSSVRQSRDRTEKLVSRPHRKSARKH